MKPRNVVLRRFDLFAPPDWRWRRVLDLADRKPEVGRPSRYDDGYIRGAWKFIQRYRSPDREPEDREDLMWEAPGPGLWFGYQIAERTQDFPEVARVIEARLLAGQDFDEIALAAGTMPDAIRWYEALFFDVASRLENVDWIVNHILVPAMRTNLPPVRPAPAPGDGDWATPFYDMTLKVMAYYGGPFMVDLCLTGFRERQAPRTEAEAAAWMESAFAQTMRRRALQTALTCQVSKYNATEILGLHLKLLEMDRNPALAKKSSDPQGEYFKGVLAKMDWKPLRRRQDAPIPAAVELRAGQQAALARGEAVETPAPQLEQRRLAMVTAAADRKEAAHEPPKESANG